MTRYLLILALLAGCGGGVPVRILVDEFTMPLDLNALASGMENQLKSTGFFPKDGTLPELWPATLPDIVQHLALSSPPKAVDLTPSDPEQAKKYKQINKVQNALVRIELNRMILRLERNTMTVPLPEMVLQIADDMSTDAEDKTAWQTIGGLPGAEAGFIGDLEFKFAKGGETFLSDQLSDANKEFAMRTLGRFTFDTNVDRHRPAGAATLRLIVVATFYIKPEATLK